MVSIQEAEARAEILAQRFNQHHWSSSNPDYAVYINFLNALSNATWVGEPANGGGFVCKAYPAGNTEQHIGSVGWFSEGYTVMSLKMRNPEQSSDNSLAQWYYDSETGEYSFEFVTSYFTDFQDFWDEVDMDISRLE